MIDRHQFRGVGAGFVGYTNSSVPSSDTRDVIVQLSETADFSSYVTTVFNNDKDNSAGQGYGVNAEYAEVAGGKTVSFQPVRILTHLLRHFNGPYQRL
jgi:hypothetical protein